MAMKPKMRFKPTILVATQATEKVVKSLNAFLKAKKNSIKRERRFYMFAFVILMFTLQITPSFILSHCTALLLLCLDAELHVDVYRQEHASPDINTNMSPTEANKQTLIVGDVIATGH